MFKYSDVFGVLVNTGSPKKATAIIPETFNSFLEMISTSNLFHESKNENCIM
jgi:hypothetical protein